MVSGRQVEGYVLADLACSRCARLDLKCSWKPSRRSGRPPKRNADHSNTTTTQYTEQDYLMDKSVSTHTSVQTIQSQLEDDEDLQRWWESGDATEAAAPGELNLNLEHYGDLLDLLSESIFQDGEFEELQKREQQWQQCLQSQQGPSDQSLNFIASPYSMNGANEGNESQGAKVVASSATIPNQFALLRDRIHGSHDGGMEFTVDSVLGADDNGEGTVDGYSTCVRNGVMRFFTGVGRSLPLYANQQDFYRQVPGCQAQLYPVAALGHALYEGHAGPSCTSMREYNKRTLASSQFLKILTVSEDAGRVAQHVAVLVLSAYLAFGTGDNEAMKRCMRLACSSAIRVGLHRMDDGRREAVEDKNAARRVWWELWVLDAIMDVVTSGAVTRSLGEVKASVNFPGNTQNRDDGRLAKVYSLRIRAVALLLDSVTALNKVPTAATVNYLAGADTVQANVIAEAQQLLIAVERTKKEQQHGIQDESVEPVLLLDSLMMLHAGRIHMHRLFWFADLTLNLQSCSFQRATIFEVDTDDGSVRDTDLRRRRLQAEMTKSVAQIIASSDAILSMMRTDTERCFRSHFLALSVLQDEQTSPGQPITSPHWPVIGCCQIVASYGLAVGMAAGKMRAASVDDNREQQMDNEVTATQTMGFLHHLVADSNDDLRAVESISGIAFAEASLDVLSAVWPIAASYREQVHACRIAIDSQLQL